MTVTQEYINELLDTAEVKEIVVFEKCLICAYKFTNGFVIVESSACVDPKNFDIDIGRKICREHVENRLWELEGYVLQHKAAKATQRRSPDAVKKSIENLSPEAKAVYDTLLSQLKSTYPVDI